MTASPRKPSQTAQQFTDAAGSICPLSRSSALLALWPGSLTPNSVLIQHWCPKMDLWKAQHGEGPGRPPVFGVGMLATALTEFRGLGVAAGWSQGSNSVTSFGDKHLLIRCPVLPALPASFNTNNAHYLKETESSEVTSQCCVRALAKLPACLGPHI